MISVCMATYNGAVFIRQQLESILLQLPNSPEDAEVVIADDGSSDKTLSIIELLRDSRIRVLPCESHLGVIYNYERALQACKGDFIFLADQDDVWLPEKVAKTLELLNEVDLVTHDAFMLCPSDDSDTPLWNRSGKLSEIRPYRSGVVCNWWKNSFTGCCMAFRRNVLNRALPFPRNLPMHDQWLGIVAERFFKVRTIEDPLVEYRQHSKNATHIGNSPAGVLQKIKWRFDLARVLFFKCVV